MSRHKSRNSARKMQARMMVRENRLNEARELYLRICNSAPDDKEAWVGLSGVSRLLGALQEAEQASRHILARYPDDPDVLHTLGAALNRQQRLDEAIACYRRVLLHKPDNLETRYFLANALRDQGAINEAEIEFTRVLALKPDHIPALNNLSALLTNRGKIRHAGEMLERGLQASPDNPQLLINVGRMKVHAGDARNAAAVYRKVIGLQPGMADAHSNLLSCLNYLPDQDPRSVSREHRRWGEIHAAAIRQVTRWENQPDPQRRLRVGYVSPDLCAHSVARFLEPVFLAHDPEQFELVCYADVPHPDSTTARLSQLCTHWRETHVLSHAQLAERVRQDRIDILVDLAGHTANNRLLMFAGKPAPVQVTWLGYPNTTGVTAMDYRLTDARADPPGATETLYTETLIRLPRSFLCYHCPADAPETGSLPLLSTDCITFGSFNNLAKTTAEVIHVWSQILKAVPDSRLLLKSRATGDADVRQRLLGLFGTQGVGGERIRFHDPVPSYQGHMAAYKQIDIALDTFPYNGTTTTCEALWMGVPVITLAGQVHAARVGVSLLTQVELEDLVASDEDSYVATAVRLSKDPDRLAAIREQLRETMRNSSLCDASGFTWELEQAYRDMWIKWCQTPTGHN